MIFQLSDETAREVSRTIQDCALPDSFAGIHNRHGDEADDEDLLYPTDVYLNRLAEHGAANLPLFITHSGDCQFGQTDAQQ